MAVEMANDPVLSRAPEARSDGLVEGATIVEAFCAKVRAIPTLPALRRHTGSGWETLTWEDYGTGATEVAAGLVDLGIGAGDRIAILSNNRVEWHLADIGTLLVGAVTVPLYQTSAAEQVAYILNHSGVRICFVENHEQRAKILEVRERLRTLERVVVFEDDEPLDDPFLTDFDELRAIGAARLQREPGCVQDRAGEVKPDQVATLVYTSGTTGPPKGAVITHANIMWTIRSVVPLLHVRNGERLISFLPLSHIAERMMSDFAAIALGGDTWFARSLATVAEDLHDCRPTVFLAVPRVWEKFQEAVLHKLAGEDGLTRMTAHRYLELGGHLVATHNGEERAPAWERLPYRAFDSLVGARIRHELGLDKAHVLITAAAPIHPDLIRWFHAIGLPLLEIYGQTESCGPTTCNPADDNHIGTVGKAIPGVSLRIADDGEILVQGGNVCAGYYGDSHGTAALIDEDGWMHSGDAGVIDADGYLHITGRKKDLIITAAGQNIAPQELETDLRQSGLISEALVVGDGRRYLTALITLNPDSLSLWARERGKLVEYEALVDDPDVLAEVDAAVAAVNSRHSHVEGIRKYRILAHDLTIAAGELTPTGKVKRSIVYDKYRELIDRMYAEDL